MSTKHIIKQDSTGRLVQAPRNVLKGLPGEVVIDETKLKSGWSIATPADIKAAADAEAARKKKEA